MPRSLYVHVPFCQRKCLYCAFNSKAGWKQDQLASYLGALLLELQGLAGGATLDLESIYLGGGTPTVLEPDQLRDLLCAIRSRLPAGATPEWTVEANPGTILPGHLEAFLQAGVTRASMGVQSFDQALLERMGRIHTAEDVEAGVEALRERTGLAVNLDLIYGLPGQDLESWRTDLERVTSLEPDHLSLYALQYEDGTGFTRDRDRGVLNEQEDDAVLEMHHLALEIVGASGFELYEISNFARPGQQSLHNLNYWANGPYYGIGAGAWARVGDRRTRNENDATSYARAIRTEGSAIVEDDLLTPANDYIESLASGLRTARGVDLDALAGSTGIDPRDLHGEHLDRLITQGLARMDGTRLVLSSEGRWLLDSVMMPFLECLPCESRVPVTIP